MSEIGELFNELELERDEWKIRAERAEAKVARLNASRKLLRNAIAAQQWRGLDTPPKPYQDVEIIVTQRATYEPGDDDLDEPRYNVYYEDDIIIGWRPLEARP